MEKNMQATLSGCSFRRASRELRLPFRQGMENQVQQQMGMTTGYLQGLRGPTITWLVVSTELRNGKEHGSCFVGCWRLIYCSSSFSHAPLFSYKPRPSQRCGSRTMAHLELRWDVYGAPVIPLK